MEALRTPDERFTDLPGYSFQPHYVEVPDGEGRQLRVHYIDEGTREAEPVLLLHGEPSWCYLYRKMVPIIAAAGFRALAPDLVGFGRSDKPSKRTDYTYRRHVDWMRSVMEQLYLEQITLVGQDWGGLIGLRLAVEHERRFARIMAANTFLPTDDTPPGEAFLRWQNFSQTTPDFPVGHIVNRGCVTELPSDVIEGTMLRSRTTATKQARGSSRCSSRRGPMTPPPKPTAARGMFWRGGRGPSSVHLATPTRLRAAATRPFSGRCRAPRDSRTRASLERATSFRRTTERSWRR